MQAREDAKDAAEARLLALFLAGFGRRLLCFRIFVVAGGDRWRRSCRSRRRQVWMTAACKKKSCDQRQAACRAIAPRNARKIMTPSQFTRGPPPPAELQPQPKRNSRGFRPRARGPSKLDELWAGSSGSSGVSPHLRHQPIAYALRIVGVARQFRRQGCAPRARRGPRST